MTKRTETLGLRVDQSDLIFQLLSTGGDGTGTTEMATDPDEYFIRPPPGKRYILRRMNVYIEDNGKFRADRYGATEALTNGIVVTIENSDGVIKTLTPKAITKVWEWGLQAGIDVWLTDVSTGNDVVLVRWTFEKAGANVVINGSDGEFLKFNVRDNLGGGGAELVSHLVEVQGYQENG